MVAYILKTIYQNRVYIKFMISGCVSITTELFVIAILTEFFDLWYVISSGIAVVIGFTISFYMQKFWTFRHGCLKKIYKEILLYLFAALVGVLVNVWVIKFVVETFRTYYNFRYDYIFAQAIIGSALGVCNFVYYKFIIFVKEKKQLHTECINKNQ